MTRRTTPRRAARTTTGAAGDTRNQPAAADATERDDPAADRNGGELGLPLLGEEVTVRRQVVPTRRVAVKRVTRERLQPIAATLMQHTVEISREPVGREVASMPAIRREGDTIVIPIVEERLVIERRLFLKEEVRVRRVRARKTHRERVVLRRHDLLISATPVEDPPGPGGPAINESRVAAPVPPRAGEIT